MRLLAIFTLLLLPISLTAQAKEPFSSTSTVYRCSRGVRIPVVYLKTGYGEFFATIYYRGKLVQMFGFQSPSGLKYASADEQLGYRWQIRKNEGILSFQAADDSATEKTIVRRCKAIGR